MSEIKVGSRVKLTKPAYKWSGWVDSMNERVNKEFIIEYIRVYDNDTGVEDDSYLRNGSVYLVDDPFIYPLDCFELVEEKKMKFKVGDRVRVVKQVNEETGWENNWINDMSDAIGEINIIKRIDKNGVYFKSSESNRNYYGYGFPLSSLELYVEPKSTVQSQDPIIKYQYLKGTDFYTVNGWADNLCLTIATKIKTSKVHGNKTVQWSVGFKHPNDQFNKSLARAAVNSKIPKRLFLGKQYSRDEIVAKILADLVYNDYFLSDEYRKFVRYLLFKFAQEI